MIIGVVNMNFIDRTVLQHQGFYSISDRISCNIPSVSNSWDWVKYPTFETGQTVRCQTAKSHENVQSDRQHKSCSFETLWDLTIILFFNRLAKVSMVFDDGSGSLVTWLCYQLSRTWPAPYTLLPTITTVTTLSYRSDYELTKDTDSQRTPHTSSSLTNY